MISKKLVLRMLIYGLVKIGKTTFTSYFKKTLFLDTQQGTKAFNVYVESVVDIIGYCGFEEYNDGHDNWKERRVMVFKPSEYLDAGDRTGFLLNSIKLPKNNSFKYFKKAFENNKEEE